MRDRVKEPRPGDVWVQSRGYVSQLWPILGEGSKEESLRRQAKRISFDNSDFVPAIVLPLDVAMQIQAEYSAKLLSAEIDGITDYSRGVRRIVDALETATGEKVEVRV
ncbi:MAG TPA: hypothetical protein PK135_11500 [Arenimonas sp.]|nr:hypothetical protein [Arenimonas sp.]